MKNYSSHFITFGKRLDNLNLALEKLTIGSNRPSIAKYLEPGAHIFLHCQSQLWAICEIVGEYHYSDTVIWENQIYPHRFSFKPIVIPKEPIPLLDGSINKLLQVASGKGWQYKHLFTPMALPKDVCDLILLRFDASTNSPSLAGKK